MASAGRTLVQIISEMVPGIIYGPQGQEIVGDLRKFHNEELHNL
jgi:hypothetical protein